MNGRLIFWTFAFGLTVAAVLTAIRGVFLAKKGRLADHQRAMDWSVRLVFGFVLAYLLKILFMGKEDLGSWQSFYVLVLRIHEGFVAGMLLTGTYARIVARDLARAIENGGALPEPIVKRHRTAGTAAVYLSLAVVCTGFCILFGMFTR